MSVDYPSLFRLNPSDIRRFLKLYDKNVSEFRAGASQLGDADSGTEKVDPLPHKFGVT